MTPSFKFRAWDESGKVMVYFDFQHLVRAALNDGRMDDGCRVQDLLDPSVPKMQSTGYLDVNDVEIFSGDILKWSHEYESDCQKDCSDQEECKNPEHVGFIHGFKVGAIRYQDGGFVVDVQTDEYDMTIIGWAMENEHTFEVIGNIHKNPELLK